MTDAKADDPYAIDASGIQSPPASLWSALFQIGPGIILAGSIVGSGELLLTTALGAQYGFVFLWLVLFSCVIKVFVQIELGRYTISSGKPTLTAFNELPGWKFGAHWMVWWWFVMTSGTIFQIGAMAGGVGQALHMAMPGVSAWLEAQCQSSLPWLVSTLHDKPEYPWAVLTTFIAIALLLSGGYKRIEFLTTILVAGVTLITVVCVALLPAMGYPVRLIDLQKGFSLGILALPATAIAASFSTFGITGVGASELYAYPYWCLEKGYARFTGPRSDKDPHWAERAKGWLRVMYLDAWVSMVVFTVATVAFYVLGATVLHRQGLVPEKSKMIATLSQMYVPAFGEWTVVVFLIGVWAVLFKTMYVATAGHSRLGADFVGLAGLAKTDTVKKREWWIRLICIMIPLVGLGLYLSVRDPKLMVVIGGFFQAATLPLLAGAALFLRYYRTDPRLAPSFWSDLLLWLAFILITAVSLYAIPMWAKNELAPMIWPAAKPL